MRNHLIYRLVIVNTVGAVLAYAAHASGMIAPIIRTDASHLSIVIVALFIAGLASTFTRAVKVGAAMNGRKSWYYTDRRKVAKMAAKNEHIGDVSNWLMTLGLLGTVIGFMMAMGGIEAGNTEGLIAGLHTAIGTTVVGAVLSLWTEVNRRMLDTATACLVEDVK